MSYPLASTRSVAFAPLAALLAVAISSSALAGSSSPIAITPDNRTVWVVNPDNDTVSAIDVQADANQKIAEVAVGDEPTNLAISPVVQKVYVANTIDGTVSVINAATRTVARVIPVGTEPYGMAFTPTGQKLYVANARDASVSVIDTRIDQVVRTIQDIGREPRGIAITNDGDQNDLDERVYVTLFNAFDVPGTIIGADDYKQGRVTVVSTTNDRVIDRIVLPPVDNVGFRSNGSALARIPAVDPPAFTVVTGAFPNSLNSIAIKGNRAYLPNNAASPDGPVRFNVNVQAFLNVIDTVTNEEGKIGGQPQTINMNRGINFEPAGPDKLFLGMPWHIAFEHDDDEGWVVAMAANILVKVALDANGTPTINAPTAAGDPGAIVRIPTGQKPTGVAINSTDTRAYVANEVSRDVTIVDLNTGAVIDTVSSAPLPTPGSLAATVQYGKGIFFSSAGVNLPTLGAVIPTGRLSSEGWSGCVSCHPFGLTDQVVWIFGAGPRKSVPLNGTFNPHDPADQKVLNYSAIFDEVQDFENNIRNVSGGLGLITLADGVTPDPALNAFNPANTGRSAGLDALEEFVARGIRTPISELYTTPQGRGPALRGNPVSPFARIVPIVRIEDQVARGRGVFEDAGCVDCHGGGGWAVSRVDYTPPPPTADVVNGQLRRFLRKVGTFDPTASNEVRQNGAAPLGADGFNPPSLLGIIAVPPYFHNGSATALEEVIVKEPRNAEDVHFVEDPGDRVSLIRFLKSIDASTEPFDVP